MHALCSSISSDHGDIHSDRSFFVVDIPDTNVVLGVQWLITLGKVTTDWKTLEMEWMDKKSGKHAMIRGMHTYPPQTVSAHRMEADF